VKALALSRVTYELAVALPNSDFFMLNVLQAGALSKSIRIPLMCSNVNHCGDESRGTINAPLLAVNLTLKEPSITACKSHEYHTLQVSIIPTH
jgi:hypothetical protein